MNDSFRKEPDAGKPQVRILWGAYDRKGCVYSTPKMQVRILWGVYDRKGCVYSTSKITATGYDVVLGTGSKKENGETRPYQYGNHKKLNFKEGTVTATFKNVPKGTWVVGMHAFNRTSEDGKKVFSPWSNLKKATVK